MSFLLCFPHIHFLLCASISSSRNVSNKLNSVRTGKDRTGLIAMLTLHIVGASDEEIIADYVLSDSAYKDIKDSKAMVVAMKQVRMLTSTSGVSSKIR